MDGQSGLILLIGLSFAGLIYFAINWLFASRQVRSMSYIEQRNAQIEEELRLERRGTRSERLKKRLQSIGYMGDPAPLAFGVAFGYLILAAGLSLLGVEAGKAVLISLPLAFVGTLVVIRRARAKRKEKAGEQILQLLRTTVTYLEAGSNPAQAFQRAALLVDNPLKSDVMELLNARIGTEALSVTLEPLNEKYPSQAMTLLLAALEVNDKVGARLAPTLRQAERIVEQQAELSAEATAEVSQAKGEFYGIAIIIGAVGVMMIITGGETAKSAYVSPIGIIAITLGLVNFGVGIWRTLRTLKKAKEGNL